MPQGQPTQPTRPWRQLCANGACGQNGRVQHISQGACALRRGVLHTDQWGGGGIATLSPGGVCTQLASTGNLGTNRPHRLQG